MNQKKKKSKKKDNADDEEVLDDNIWEEDNYECDLIGSDYNDESNYE